MTTKPNLPQRKLHRLEGYDYSCEGLYFITICIDRLKNPKWMPFGKVANGEMILNDAGKMVERWYWELENKYPDKRCHEMVIMPNHMHFIIENETGNKMEGRNENLTVDNGKNSVGGKNPTVDHVGSTLRGRPKSKYGIDNKKFGVNIFEMTGWFITMTTNEYIRGVKTMGWDRYNKKLWQRASWDHIIRDERSYHTLADYIHDNPQNWLNDKFYEP